MSAQALSEELANIVEQASGGVLRVEGQRRRASSGLVWSRDGVIVAAHHSVDADEEVGIGLPDGATATARVVGRDPGSDLTVLRAEGSVGHPVRWAEGGAVRAGQLVLGLSRPGRALRVQLGVVSAVAGSWRTPAGGRLDRYLESDLTLHPGFSGGLLLGVEGAALGLNTAGLVRGAAMAIPPETLRGMVETLLTRGRVRRGFIGIGTQPVPLTGELRSRFGQSSALIVLSVQPGSPAERAGLVLGDVLLKAGDDKLTHPAALLPALDEEKIGREITIESLRTGEVRPLTVIVGERDAS
jgi:S1-C subfamily serine protease